MVWCWRRFGPVGCLLGLLAASVLGLASRASSQEPQRQSAEYRNVVRDALREFELGNWEEAQALFERAHTIAPSARTLRGIGFCLFERRHYVEASDFLRRALSSPDTPLTRTQRESTEKLLGRARAFVAYVPLSVAPDDAELTVDGARAVWDEGGELALDPGEHELSLRASGYEPRNLRVQVKSGTNEPLEIALRELALARVESAPSGVQKGPRAAAAPDRSQSRAGLKRRLTVAGAVVLGASLITAAVTGGLALKRGHALSDECPQGICPPDKQDELDTAKTIALVSSVSLGVAGVGAGLLLTGILLPSGADKRVQTTLRIRGSGLEVQGQF